MLSWRWNPIAEIIHLRLRRIGAEIDRLRAQYDFEYEHQVKGWETTLRRLAVLGYVEAQMMKELGLPHVDLDVMVEQADKVDKERTQRFIDGIRAEAAKEVGW